MQSRQDDHPNFFEQVYNYAPIGIALVSLEGTWIKVNPAACKIFGYPEDELMELTFRDITHPDDIQKNNDYILEVLEGKLSFYDMEKRYIQKDGTVRWVSLHVSLVRHETDGTPSYLIAHMIDIDRKKEAELKLLEYEESYRLITENALDIISYVTPNGVTQYCSPSIRDLLGYEPEEVIGKSNLELYHPDDLKEIKAKSFSDNDVFTCRVRHKNGSYLWFESTIRTIRDKQGNIEKVLGIGREITERKKYEDNLAEAQRIAALGSWEWDIEQDKLTLSEQVYEIFDLEKNKLETNDLLFLIHPDEQQQFSDSIAQALKGCGFSGEFRHLQSDGSVKYLQIQVSVICDDKGTPLRMTGTTQDITERKKAELKLREAVERYTSLKKYNHDAIMSLDLEGHIINTNVVAEQLTGYKVGEMIGESVSKFIGTDNLHSLLTDFKDHSAVERNIDKIRHKDGHSVEVLTTIAPIIIDEKTVGYYIIAKDITEQKKLLIAKETAERTNQAKSEFLAMMSHEIRTPMNGVIGMTQLLLETTELDEQQKEYVDIISKSGNSLLGLINDILDLSKIESGRIELAEEPFGVSEILKEALDILLPKANEKKLRLTVSMSSAVPPIILGDAKRLRQILINLIGNAVKFTFDGHVAISASMTARERDRVQLQFSIKDTGIGIPEDKIVHLFEPFYQLDHFMTRQTDGTGLGLAISKKLVELMGGEIGGESGDGTGTTFVFTAWFRTENMGDAKPRNPSVQGDGGKSSALKILIAEDNVINQLVLKKILERLGFHSDIVKNGKEVIQAQAGEGYEIIFMDVQMPVMNGLETAKLLKETLSPESCPYIIAVTANALIGDREKCLSSGMDEYISKPLRFEAVKQVIETYRSRQRR